MMSANNVTSYNGFPSVTSTHLSRPILASYGVIGVLGTASNLKAAWHIWKNFGLAKAMFLLLFMDTAICLAASSVLVNAGPSRDLAGSGF